MFGKVCPECGFIHPPVPEGQKCPVANSKNNSDTSILKFITPSINKAENLIQQFPSQKEKIISSIRNNLQKTIKELEEELNARID